MFSIKLTQNLWDVPYYPLLLALNYNKLSFRVAELFRTVSLYYCLFEIPETLLGLFCFNNYSFFYSGSINDWFILFFKLTNYSNDVDLRNYLFS